MAAAAAGCAVTPKGRSDCRAGATHPRPHRPINPPSGPITAAQPNRTVPFTPPRRHRTNDRLASRSGGASMRSKAASLPPGSKCRAPQAAAAPRLQSSAPSLRRTASPARATLLRLIRNHRGAAMGGVGDRHRAERLTMCRRLGFSHRRRDHLLMAGSDRQSIPAMAPDRATDHQSRSAPADWRW